MASALIDLVIENASLGSTLGFVSRPRDPLKDELIVGQTFVAQPPRTTLAVRTTGRSFAR
ncbi:MAG: hypothetical protein ACI9BW_003940 [Gammaproteobacteria bacterium]|jgi:hypothetical protein